MKLLSKFLQEVYYHDRRQFLLLETQKYSEKSLKVFSAKLTSKFRCLTKTRVE